MFIIIFLVTTIAVIYKDISNRNKYFEEIKEYIPKFTNVLDFGAGRCELSTYLKNRNYVTSVDIYAGCPGADVYDGYKLPYADDSFDVVVCMFVLHHIPHHRAIIEELKRVCARRIIIVEDMPQTFYQHLISKLHYLFFKQPMSTIKNMHSPQTWCELLEDRGVCTIKQLKSHSFINNTPHFLVVKDFSMKQW
ncbi:class I SAM-dependent methyltransferase [Dishui Lake phycodnavirus 2]|nr:class I SAM-dependent methyltransferase [Dishui Lake phycodnavirus 2]